MRWAAAEQAASSLAPPVEWRKALATKIREAADAMLVSVLTCPPGYWTRLQHDTVPERYDRVIERIAAEFQPRIESAGEDWRFALGQHGLVYAPLETALARPLADELYREVLAPEGIRGWIVSWLVTRQQRLVGLVVVGTRDPSSQALPRLRAPLSEVVRRAGATLETTLELAQGCGVIVPELDETKPSLTPREKQIADLVALGFSNANIAAKLTLSANTVGAHLRHIYRKLGVHSRVELTGAMQRRAG